MREPVELDKVVLGLRAIRKTGLHNIVKFHTALLEVLDLPENCSTAQARNRVSRELLSCLHRLDRQLQVAFLDSAGFAPGSSRGAETRLEAAASHLGVSVRTARRYADQAALAVANLLLSKYHNPQIQDRDWLITRAACSLDLRHSDPWIRMERTISPQSRTVTRFEDQISFPRLKNRPLKYRVLEGCQLDELAAQGCGAWKAALNLPHPVTFGQHHTFTVSIGLPDQEAIEPIIGFFPFTRTQNATLHIRFGARRPTWMSIFENAIPVGSFPGLTSRELEPGLGEYHSSFAEMIPGHAYGMRWKW